MATDRKWRHTARWQRLRAQVMRAQPLCADCLRRERTAAAEEVDHIIPVHLGGAVFDVANLQALCSACHRVKTNREIKAKAGWRGCDVDGNPYPSQVVT